jgi:hypothetical protein
MKTWQVGMHACMHACDQDHVVLEGEGVQSINQSSLQSRLLNLGGHYHTGSSPMNAHGSNQSARASIQLAFVIALSACLPGPAVDSSALYGRMSQAQDTLVLHCLGGRGQ